MLRHSGLTETCRKVETSDVDMSLVARIHDNEYVERLEHACQVNLPFIDVTDTAICEGSFGIAKLAAGAVINAVDDVL